MKVLITGSRENANNAETRQRIKNALSVLEMELATQEVNEGTDPMDVSHETTTEIWHGGAHGTDQAAHDVAKERGCEVHVIRPDYSTGDPKRAPLARNKKLVEKANYVLALYSKRGKTGGTAHTASEAMKKGKGLLECYEDGTTKWTPSTLKPLSLF